MASRDHAEAAVFGVHVDERCPDRGGSESRLIHEGPVLMGGHETRLMRVLHHEARDEGLVVVNMGAEGLAGHPLDLGTRRANEVLILKIHAHAEPASRNALLVETLGEVEQAGNLVRGQQVEDDVAVAFEQSLHPIVAEEGVLGPEGVGQPERGQCTQKIDRRERRAAFKPREAVLV